MALLLIVSSWLLVSWLVAGLCLAARLGDRQVQRGLHARRAGATDESPALDLHERRAA